MLMKNKYGDQIEKEPSMPKNPEKQGQILVYLGTLEKLTNNHVSQLNRLYNKLQPVMETQDSDEGVEKQADTSKTPRVAERLQELISRVQLQMEIVDEMLAKIQL